MAESSTIRNNIEEKKEQISGTVQQIQSKFQGVDLKRRTADAPWAMFGISVAVGFALAGGSRPLFEGIFRNLGTALTTAAGAYVASQFGVQQSAASRVSR